MLKHPNGRLLMMTRVLLMFVLMTCLGGCAARPGEPVRRHGDEIIVAGERFRIGTPVVLWTDPDGYDAYRVERRFVPRDEAAWDASTEKLSTPNRYGLRHANQWSDDEYEQLRGGGWDLQTLQETVDLFVIHYDACGTSQRCFQILHDVRGLSVHFMLDLDGTIYQTLDLKERAWHASHANDRSIGVEIANIGAYSPQKADTLDKWYAVDPDGRARVTLPESWGDGGIRTPGFTARPDRHRPVAGQVNGHALRQYDLTAEQYAALAKLSAALSRIFPKIALDAPRDEAGEVVNRVLDEAEFARFHGIVGHYHVTDRKIDPGPAFQWDRLLKEARALRR